MIDRAAIEQILDQYKKYGWNLRRVLLSAESGKNCDLSLFNDADIVDAKLDAIWFSRSSRPDSTAWELRHLSNDPYALVTGVPSGSSKAETDAILEDTENKMLDVMRARKPSGN